MTNPNTERLTALVSPKLKRRVRKVAKANPEQLWMNFRPSDTEVVRTALEFFFAYCVSPNGTLRYNMRDILAMLPPLPSPLVESAPSSPVEPNGNDAESNGEHIS